MIFHQIVGQASGGHINPAVTVAMLVAGKISVVRTILYIAFQCLGATAGTAAIKVDNFHICHMTHTLTG